MDINNNNACTSSAEPSPQIWSVIRKQELLLTEISTI